MSKMIGPRIVTDGLVLAFDALDKNSYVGSGSTIKNIIPTGTHAIGMANHTTLTAGGFAMDGLDDYIAISHSSTNTDMRAYNATINLIVSMTSVVGQKVLVSFRSSGGAPLYIGRTGTQILCYDELLSSPAYSAGTLYANRPFMCTVVCDATTGVWKVYVNGTLAGQSSVRTGWVATYGAGNIYIGLDAPNGEYQTGTFYAFQHYNRVLTDAEVAQNFRALRGRFGI